MIDDASRGQYNYEYITEAINNRKSPYVHRFSGHEFTIAHYTGKVNYDARDLIEKNRDFLPPEMMETLRASRELIVRTCFTNPLSKSGNLTMSIIEDTNGDEKVKSKSKWGAALISEKTKTKVWMSLKYLEILKK